MFRVKHFHMLKNEIIKKQVKNTKIQCVKNYNQCVKNTFFFSVKIHVFTVKNFGMLKMKFLKNKQNTLNIGM